MHNSAPYKNYGVLSGKWILTNLNTSIAFKRSTDMSLWLATLLNTVKYIVNRHLWRSPEHKHKYALERLANMFCQYDIF